MTFDAPYARDRSLVCRCAKCNIELAKLEIIAVYRLAFYICEKCFKKFEKTHTTEIIEL